MPSTQKDELTASLKRLRAKEIKQLEALEATQAKIADIEARLPDASTEMSGEPPTSEHIARAE